MKKNAIITVVSKPIEEEEDTIEVVTPGEFYLKEGIYYAVYEETEISGMKGTTTTLEIHPEKIVLIRVGTTSTKMNFCLGKKELTLYNTPHGGLELTINTVKLKINVGEQGGDILIDYDMIVNGQQIINTVLQINIKAQ